MNTPDKNSAESSRLPLALIAGPTASGKSALALELAEREDGIVINADASQVYADLSVLSARPSQEDMARAPHRLFGIIDGNEACSAARWAQEAKREIATAHDRGKVPILVGGTGLYIRTLLDGIAPVPEIDADIRAEVRALPVADAYAALVREDAPSASKLAPADVSRISRALEVIRSTGRSILDWRAKKEGGIGSMIDLRPLILLPPREWLYERCNARFEAMLEHGAIEEVEALLSRKLSPDLPVMRAIGVPEIAAWLAGEISRSDLVPRGQIATRQYAKRQYTWFSRQPPDDWQTFTGKLDYMEIAKVVIKLQ